jgi:hypothetical protein
MYLHVFIVTHMYADFELQIVAKILSATMRS